MSELAIKEKYMVFVKGNRGGLDYNGSTNLQQEYLVMFLNYEKKKYVGLEER